MDEQSFARGQTVALRYITRDGRPGMSWPFIVVEDSPQATALFIPNGASHMRWTNDGGPRRLAAAPWRTDTLRLMFPGAHHSVWLTWAHEGGQRLFRGYYVNMEEPFRRTPIGFDTNDHMLDITVTPALEWQWKDEQVLADRVAQGVYSSEFAEAVRAEGMRVIDAIERRQSPFSGDYETWQPDPAWVVPMLPDNWDSLPASLWNRRHWAYLDPRS